MCEALLNFVFVRGGVEGGWGGEAGQEKNENYQQSEFIAYSKP